ncbi:MAG: wax ester/triacylglycerol synthase domain-containing protein, partial [Pseudomonadales bacterium]
MQQLNGLEGLSLQAEMPGLPMTVSPIAIYDPSTAPGGQVRFKDILQVFENNLPKNSLFRRRLLKVPLNLDHPYWIEDQEFDIEYHVRHIALPQPGDWRQLYIQLARLKSRPLDRARPLWEAYVIEGLNKLNGIPPGSFCIMLRIHQAAMGGLTGLDWFTAMHDLSPAKPVRSSRPPVPMKEAAPASTELLRRAAVNSLRRGVKSIKLIGDSLNSYQAVSSAQR